MSGPVPAASLRFRGVRIRDFRNLAAVDLEPGPRLNVLSGDNGQGKTSLLEALYVVATTRSFRADKLKELVRTGAERAVVEAKVDEDGLVHEQRVVLGERSRSVLLDGKRPERLSAYAVRTPMVVFHPGDLLLVGGPAQLRRTLLDRVALHLEPSSSDARLRYAEALKDRQRLLEEQGTRAAPLDAFEAVAAQAGSVFARVRQRAAEAMLAALTPAFERMAAEDCRLVARYEPGGVEDPAEFLRQLQASRPADQRRKSACFGPQRDELTLELDGRSARRHGSQGQQRILTLALKLAELDCVRAARGAEPVLLLDDFSSELDPARTGAVYRLVRATRGQVLVTTTRPELFVTPEELAEERVDLHVSGGQLRRR